jgi:4,5-DOPA dioxygenase extradiol
MTYDTPDATALGARIAAAIPGEFPFAQAPSRGLDHGAWVPLKVMYPFADVPSVQLSIPTHDPATLLDLGRALAPLREEGILVIGSGFMTHGLPYLSAENFQHNTVPTWSREFDDWAAGAIAAKDVDMLANYAAVAPALRFAHPTAEHFTPLFVALGLGSDGGAIDTAVEGFQFGLSKRSLTIW